MACSIMKLFWRVILEQFFWFRSYFLPSQYKTKHFFLFTSVFLAFFFLSLSPIFSCVIFLILAFHVQFGLHEVIKDYVHDEWSQSFCYLCVRVIVLLVVKCLLVFFFG